MEKFEAKILLKNLLGRVVEEEDGRFVLEGRLTDDELEALKFALSMMDAENIVPTVVEQSKETEVASITADVPPLPDYQPEEKLQEDDESGPTSESKPEPEISHIDIDTSVLSLPDAPSNVRLCLDFGTAMSKSTLVVDGADDIDDEVITVLPLGEHGDDVEDFKLVSAVYIDNDGLLWFGAMAEEYCGRDAPDGSRQLMDNIKHWLSLGQIDAEVVDRFNPTDISITYADVILAYLTFLTWTVNKALENMEQPPGGYPRNINRRFAMPCLSEVESREVQYRLRKYLGEAQILADTFFSDLREGLSLQRFMDAVKQMREQGGREYSFIKEGITEPLGVAGTLLSYYNEKPHHMVVMVIDVGAGTSDFSMYRMHVDPEREYSIAIEAKGSVGGVTEAGNHLDLVLMGLIVQTCGIDEKHTMWNTINWFLQRNISDFKETLFNEGVLYVSLPSGEEADLTLEQFIATPGVKRFKAALNDKMKEILENVSDDWISLIGSQKIPYLTVALTGGGATLPMVRELAKRKMTVKGKEIRVEPAKDFPSWIEDAQPELEADYPRIAVSLGGARKKLIKGLGSSTHAPGGDVGKLIYDDPRYQW